MKLIVRGSATCICTYSSEIIDQLSECRATSEPRPKNWLEKHSHIKVILAVLFDYRHVMHFEFRSSCQTINKQYFIELQLLRRPQRIVEENK